MARITYTTLKNRAGFFDLMIIFNLVIVAAGMGAVWYVEHYGHIVTGMGNKIVWGLPHVFAIFLIIAASGALNVASISSVFSKPEYKPYARLSGLLALSLLAGGLAVLVLDLGRPDRLLIAMTTYNFKSIFAWNIYLYTGFMAIVIVYLWAMMARNMDKYSKPMGFIAFAWRLILTTGTGSIFGFIVAREAFNSAVMAPLFIASSFVYGLAFTIVVLNLVARARQRELMPDILIEKFRGLLITFTVAVIFLTIILHITNLYASGRQDVEWFMLASGNIYSQVFWIGQIAIGTLAPLALLIIPRKTDKRRTLLLPSLLLLFGGLAQIYALLIGGQAYPLDLFPGMEISSSFQDGEVASYIPTLPEILLGISGISIAMLISGIVMRLMPFLPKGESA
ncbi:MAG: polysulfide reductase NrfD [Rhizobiaceae bacterium]|nr:polysulfide reductase NrfD [Rhizobiaceae bacterium]